jgi:hypothetical protein
MYVQMYKCTTVQIDIQKHSCKCYKCNKLYEEPRRTIWNEVKVVPIVILSCTEVDLKISIGMHVFTTVSVTPYFCNEIYEDSYYVAVVPHFIAST